MCRCIDIAHSIIRVGGGGVGGEVLGLLRRYTESSRGEVRCGCRDDCLGLDLFIGLQQQQQQHQRSSHLILLSVFVRRFIGESGGPWRRRLWNRISDSPVVCPGIRADLQ